MPIDFEQRALSGQIADAESDDRELGHALMSIERNGVALMGNIETRQVCSRTSQFSIAIGLCTGRARCSVAQCAPALEVGFVRAYGSREVYTRHTDAAQGHRCDCHSRER